MATPTVRIVRRPRGGTPARPRKALTAASQVITDSSKAFKKSLDGRSRDNWQQRAWDYYAQVGELHYYVSWRAASASRGRLVAMDVDPVTGMPTGPTENKRVAAIVRSFAGGPTGQAQWIKRQTECLTVPGELYNVIIFPPKAPPEGLWYAVTREELKISPRETSVMLPTGEKYVLNDSRDSLSRVWNPSARLASEADSPVRAIMDSLEEIVRTTKTINNAAKSRLIGNGIVFVPHEMSLPSTNSSVVANGMGDDSDPVLVGQPAVQQMTDLLYNVAEVAIEDPDSMAALVPIIAGVPGEFIKNVAHIKFENTITDVSIKTRNEAIGRVALGLDVSPERMLGVGGESNHWSAWQVGDDDVRLHIAPVLETICAALNQDVFWPVLEREGLAKAGEPRKFMVWYDVSELTEDPDLTEEARDGFDRGIYRSDATRMKMGLDEEGYDFTTPEGREIWAWDRASQDPTLLPTLQPLMPSIKDVEFPKAVAPMPPGQDSAEDDDAVADGKTKQAEPDTEDDAADTKVAARSRVTSLVERSRVATAKRERAGR